MSIESPKPNHTPPRPSAGYMSMLTFEMDHHMETFLHRTRPETAHQVVPSSYRIDNYLVEVDTNVYV